MADTFRLDYAGTKVIKGASVVMGYLKLVCVYQTSIALARLQELAVLGANDTNPVSIMRLSTLKLKPLRKNLTQWVLPLTKAKTFLFMSGSEYVSMGGRNAEMTFGIGKISYTEVFEQPELLMRVYQTLVS